MKQLLLSVPNLKSVSAEEKTKDGFTKVAKNVLIITPGGHISGPVFFEIDDDGKSIYHESDPDPDDMTDYWYWRYRIRKDYKPLS